MKMINSLMIAGFFGIITVGCNTTDAPVTEQSDNAPAWTAYGEAFEMGETVSIDSVPALLASTGEAAGLFEVEIVETCTKMGCWMSVQGPQGEPVMVYMKDHAFFVPKSGMEGKRAIISGYAYNDTVSVELQQHLLEDANRSQEEIDAVVDVKYELAFSAAGVQIEGHLTEDHDHEGHDHEGHDHEGHDHEGHDHEGHDHEGHTH
jgi:hypothetical protein